MNITNTPARKPRRMARNPDPAVALGSTGANEKLQHTAPNRTSKQDMVIALLRREGGALLTELVEVTGWLPHTARAALTGLRKKGHDVIGVKTNKVTRYSIATK